MTFSSKFKKVTIGTISLLSVGLLLTACSSSGDVDNIEKISKNEATKEVEAFYKKIDPTKAKLSKDIDNTTLDTKEELPDIDKNYPLTVKGDGDINVEVFVSPEKAGKGEDGIINEIAENFNNEKQTVNNKRISVSIRSVPSGTAIDYISSKNHVPDGYTPSNPQWNYILTSKGFNTKEVTNRLFGNTSGLLMKKKTYEGIKKKYGDINIDTLNKAVNNGYLLGYTNPYTSSTGMSLLSQLLFNFDPENPISDKAKNEFQKFQSNIPSTFVTTTQLRDAAKSGNADILSISYQTYINTPEFKDYKYIPFGIRQDSPLYATTDNSEKQEVLKKFADYIKQDDNQQKATQYGFNKNDDYTFEEKTKDGNLLQSMQDLWKVNKNGGEPIIGVFLTDRSGSMNGEPMNNVKKSLLNSMQYIGDENLIGLVSYSDDVQIDVPIGAMNGTQKAYMTSAIKNMNPGGGTNTYNGVLVAIKMLQDKMKEHPNARPVIFVLSDGETTGGYSFNRVAPIIKSLGITVHTIGYNADLKELAKLSKINESVSIDADNDNVVYKLKELFNAEF
jgi:von willebrand factor type A